MPKGALSVHSLSNGGLAFKLGNFVLLKITHRQLNFLFVCLFAYIQEKKAPFNSKVQYTRRYFLASLGLNLATFYMGEEPRHECSIKKDDNKYILCEQKYPMTYREMFILSHFSLIRHCPNFFQK